MNPPSQGDLILSNLFEEVSQEKPISPYEDFFLLSNPFPLGEFYDFCVNQELVKEEFRRILRTFYIDSQLQIMTILGSTGAGKTTLLKFLEQTLKKWREPNSEKKVILDLFTVFIERPLGSYLEVHRQIISQFDAMFFTEFFSMVQQRKINLSELHTKLPGINPELIQTLAYIAHGGHQQLHLQYDSDQNFFSLAPQTYRILANWLQGVKLTADEKKQLGNVSTEVGKSATVAIKFLSDLVKIFLHVGLFKGVIVFFDEFEELVSGRSAISQAQYAQDLRNLFDSHPKGVVFIVATAPITESLQRISPALQRRLGAGVQIASISCEDAALEYAQAYIRWGRQKFQEEKDCEIRLPEDCPDVDGPYYPLTQIKVKKLYNRLKDTYGSENVIPGSLLPELHYLLYQRVYEGK